MITKAKVQKYNELQEEFDREIDLLVKEYGTVTQTKMEYVDRYDIDTIKTRIELSSGYYYGETTTFTIETKFLFMPSEVRMKIWAEEYAAVLKKEAEQKKKSNEQKLEALRRQIQKTEQEIQRLSDELGSKTE